MDIISNHVQTSLSHIENTKTEKQEKVLRLQKDVSMGTLKPLKDKQSLEKNEMLWQMNSTVRNKYFNDKFFEKQDNKTNNRPKHTETIN